MLQDLEEKKKDGDAILSHNFNLMFEQFILFFIRLKRDQLDFSVIG